LTPEEARFVGEVGESDFFFAPVRSCGGVFSTFPWWEGRADLADEGFALFTAVPGLLFFAVLETC
jgi:hypothetical protein